MASSWTALAQGVAFPTSATAKTLFKLYNTHATQKLNITRMWLINTQLTAVTGVFQTLSLGRYTTDQTTGLTAVTPIKHDTNDATTLTVSCGYAPTTSVTLVDTFAQFVRSGDEFATGVSKIENMYALPQLALIFDSGYGDTNCTPIVLNTNEGIALTSAGVASGVGAYDIKCEFYVS